MATRWTVFIVMLTSIAATPAADAPRPGTQWLYVGTYTTAKNGSRGIYRFSFDPSTGKLTSGGLAAEAVNPSFLAIHPSRKFLFSVGEFDGPQGKASGVSSFRIDPKSGMLSLINQQPSGGKAPCHIAVDRTGKDVLVANYGSGEAAVLQVDNDGALTGPTMTVSNAGTGPNRKRQEGPHAHCAVLDPANRFALFVDLGNDAVWVYQFDAARGTLGPKQSVYHTKPGAGPRHFAFHPDGKRGYLINELDCTLSALDYDAEHGKLTERQTISTLPGGFKDDYSGAEVVVHPSGNFVYASNRGHNSIAVFAIDADGKLRLIGHQGDGVKTPRNFNVDPTGNWMIVANQDGNSLIVYLIDPETGLLRPTSVRAEVGGPVCVVFMVPPS